MKKITLIISLTALVFSAACGGAKIDTATANKPAAAENKSTAASSPAASTATAGAPSATVKQVYDNAMKHDGKAILPLLTKEFKDGVGSDTKDNMDALCDSFTDSGKVTAFEVKGEKVTGDSAVVTVALTYKDGKKEDKDEKVKKADGKWLMDS